MPRERSPRAVFDRLYRASSLGADPRHASILDVVRQDARSLRSRVSSEDGEKVEEYLEGARKLVGEAVASYAGRPAGGVRLSEDFEHLRWFPLPAEVQAELAAGAGGA